MSRNAWIQRIGLLCLLVLAVPFAAMAESEDNGPAPGCGAEEWQSTGGTVAFVPNETALGGLGVEITDAAATDVTELAPELQTVFAAVDAPGIEIVSYDGVFRAFAGGRVQTLGEMTLRTQLRTVTLGDLRIERNRDELRGVRWIMVDTANDGIEAFDLMPSGAVNLDRDAGKVHWSGLEVYLAPELASALGVDIEGADSIGRLFFSAELQAAEGTIALESDDRPQVARSSRGGIGPDVIVGDIYDIRKWGTVGSQSSWSFGTESCNIGDVEAEWFANTNKHPVIGQSVFRYKDGRFELIGMGWLKHSFCAIDLTLCDPCVDLFGCDYLSVGCSDPYSAGLNGSQGGLGPRYQVNASTGVFPYPPANPSYSGSLARRTILNHSDINPAQNPGALFYVESQYVTQDDTAAGNNMNNTSYRRIQVSASNVISFVPGQGTEREVPAIAAWPNIDPNAQVSTYDIPNDGRLYIGSSYRDNGNGTWDYNYTIYNLNSHECVRRFEIVIPNGVNTSNYYFRDTEYHSGETVNNTDWTFSTLANGIQWETQPASQNANANAIRWSTSASFGFTADTEPENGLAWLEQFRSANQFRVSLLAPSEPTTGQFDLTVGLSTGDPNVSPGERFNADATLMTGAIPTTQVEFTLEAEKPDGSPYEGNPLISRTKNIPGNISKNRAVRFNVPVDADLGQWKLRLIAERVSDGATESVELPFNVN